MTLKLDLKDRKLLTILDENSAYTNSQIAKKIGLSKPAVEYRIQRLLKEKAIFNFYTTIDFTKLGYSQYKIYFKFQNITLEDEKRITDYWIKNKNSVWLAQIRGKWDLAVSIIAKSNFELGEILNKFLVHYSKFILEKDILLTEYSPIYPREYLNQTAPPEFIYGKPSQFYELDETDVKILKEISNNTRINIIDLAEKTKLTRDIINYRLKKLEKNKIIVKYGCYPNLQNIGINHYKIILRTKNFNSENEKALQSYIANHKKATQLLKLIGSWDWEIEFETENEDELYNILTDLRKKFSEVIRDFDILRITQTFKYNYFPF
jgi:DNA-binding Lrp family transcriptional regulator